MFTTKTEVNGTLYPLPISLFAQSGKHILICAPLVSEAILIVPFYAHRRPFSIATNRSNKYKLSCGPGLASG